VQPTLLALASGPGTTSSSPEETVVVGAFTLLDVFLVLFWFFVMMLILLLFAVLFADIWGRDDLSGWGKALWIVAIIIFPFIGVLVYLIARPRDLPHKRIFGRY
jgi:hypothetical protein